LLAKVVDNTTLGALVFEKYLRCCTKQARLVLKATPENFKGCFGHSVKVAEQMKIGI
jgi:hypothetical protein